MERKFTLVQHSGFGYGHKQGWSMAIEVMPIKTRAALQRVIGLGGTVWDTYQEADNASDVENYQPDNAGLCPLVPGSFSNYELDGLALYLPAKMDA